MYYAIPGRARAWRTFYRPFVQPGDLCFDLGAHVGNRTAALLALGCRVVALEPQPLFGKTLQLIYGKRVGFTQLPAAISAADGRATMRASTRTPTVSTLSDDWAAEVGRDPSFATVIWDKTLDVDLRSLDSLIAQFGMPAFCKLDVEGYELQALQGLSRPIRLLSYEFVPAALGRAWECLNRLQELGYRRFNYIKGEFPRFASPAWLTAADLRNRIEALPNDGRAGEIYAEQDG